MNKLQQTRECLFSLKRGVIVIKILLTTFLEISGLNRRPTKRLSHRLSDQVQLFLSSNVVVHPQSGTGFDRGFDYDVALVSIGIVNKFHFFHFELTEKQFVNGICDLKRG